MLTVNGFYVARLAAERELRFNADLREPDRLTTDAGMKAAWNGFFPAPLDPDPARIDQPQSAVGHRGGLSGLSLVHGGSTPVLGASRWGSSLNWSGATLAARDGGAFKAVMARFTLPQMLPPGSVPVKDLPGPANAYVGSVWVGLDGVRRSAPSLPQAGIAIGWVHPAGGAQRGESYAWAQWWTTDNLEGEMRATDRFAVHAGDTVRIWVSMEADGTAYFRVHNENAQPGMRKDAIAAWLPEGRVDQGAAAGARIGRRPDVRGSAASFVVERPMALVTPEAFARDFAFDQRALLYPLPNFGLVQFDQCAALMEPAGGGDCVVRDLRGCRFLRMVRQEPAAGRVLRLARPRPGYHSGQRADHAFHVTYEAPPGMASGAEIAPGTF